MSVHPPEAGSEGVKAFSYEMLTHGERIRSAESRSIHSKNANKHILCHYWDIVRELQKQRV